MKKPRSRKRRGGRKLGKISSSTERNISQSFHSKDASDVPGHFMYNKDDDAIQQVLKLPDISVSETNEIKEGSGQALSLPPINFDAKSQAAGDRRQPMDGTKLPRISHDVNLQGRPARGSSWLERQDVTCISWKKALSALDSGKETDEQRGREAAA